MNGKWEDEMKKVMNAFGDAAAQSEDNIYIHAYMSVVGGA